MRGQGQRRTPELQPGPGHREERRRQREAGTGRSQTGDLWAVRDRSKGCHMTRWTVGLSLRWETWQEASLGKERDESGHTERGLPGPGGLPRQELRVKWRRSTWLVVEPRELMKDSSEEEEEEEEQGTGRDSGCG